MAEQDTPGVESWLPDDAMERLAEALGGRVWQPRRREPAPDGEAGVDWMSGDD